MYPEFIWQRTIFINKKLCAFCITCVLAVFHAFTNSVNVFVWLRRQCPWRFVLRFCDTFNIPCTSSLFILLPAYYVSLCNWDLLICMFLRHHCVCMTSSFCMIDVSSLWVWDIILYEWHVMTSSLCVYVIIFLCVWHHSVFMTLYVWPHHSVCTSCRCARWPTLLMCRCGWSDRRWTWRSACLTGCTRTPL